MNRTMDEEFADMVREQEQQGVFNRPKELGNTPTDRVLDAVQNIKTKQPTPADSLRMAAKELEEITKNMVGVVSNVANDIEQHLLKVHRFNAVVADTWRKEIDPTDTSDDNKG